MCDPVIGGAVAIAAGATIYSSNKASKSADKQTDAMNRATDQAGIAANRQADLAEEQWERYLNTFAPLEDQIVKESTKSIDPLMPVGFDRMMATTDRDFANASANTARAMGGRYQYGGGVEQAAQGAIERGRIGAKTDIRIAKTNSENQAKRDAEQQRFVNMMNTASIGKGLPANAQAGFSSNAQTYAGLAGMHANAASNANNASAQAWSSFGNTAGNLTQMYMMNKMMQPKTQMTPITTPSYGNNTAWA